jgi:hypothetical protein
MHLNSGPGFGVAGPEFGSFCVDFDHNVFPGMTYLVQPRSTDSGLAQGPQIAYLYQAVAGGGQATLTDDQAAGLQLALWKLQTDGDGPLNTGNFEYLANDAAAAAAESYLALAASAAGQGVWLDASPGDVIGPRGQSVLGPGDLIKPPTPNGPGSPPIGPADPLPVPEPGSALLLGLGLVAAALYRRRQRPEKLGGAP